MWPWDALDLYGNTAADNSFMDRQQTTKKEPVCNGSGLDCCKEKAIWGLIHYGHERKFMKRLAMNIWLALGCFR